MSSQHMFQFIGIGIPILCFIIGVVGYLIAKKLYLPTAIVFILSLLVVLIGFGKSLFVWVVLYTLITFIGSLFIRGVLRTFFR